MRCFLTCFLFAAGTPDEVTDNYDIAIKQLNRYIRQTEEEHSFLSKQETKSTLPRILAQVRAELNTAATCTLNIIGSQAITLKVDTLVQEQGEFEFQIPFCYNPKELTKSMPYNSQVHKILSYVDGANHVKKIAFMSGLDSATVSKHLSELAAANHVGLTEMLQFANRYRVTSKIHLLATDHKLQEECLRFVTLQGHAQPTLPVVLAMYAKLKPELNIMCDPLNFRSKGVDCRQLVKFGLLHEIVKQAATPQSIFDDVCCKAATIPENSRSILREPTWTARYFV